MKFVQEYILKTIKYYSLSFKILYRCILLNITDKLPTIKISITPFQSLNLVKYLNTELIEKHFKLNSGGNCVESDLCS